MEKVMIELASGEIGQIGDIRFFPGAASDAPTLTLKADGSILIGDRLAATDLEVVDGLRAFVTSATRPHALDLSTVSDDALVAELAKRQMKRALDP